MSRPTITATAGVSCVLMVFLCLGPVTTGTIVFPSKVHTVDNPTCHGSRLHKITLVQTNYVQYSEFATEIPRLNGFFTCAWMTVEDGTKTATLLNYALDEESNTDNLTIQYRPSEGIWSLNLNGVRTYSAKAVPLIPNTWTHTCHSWDGKTGQWSVWQSGQLLDAGVNTYSIGTQIPPSGVLVTGQHQNTAANMGMDNGEGITGSITLLHVSSTPLGSPRSRDTHRLVQHLANDCTAVDRGDVVGWLRTPRRDYGGVLVETAFEKCGRF